MVFVTYECQKIMVLQNPLEYTSVLCFQNLYQVCLAYSTKRDYLAPLEFDPVICIFTPDKVCRPYFLVYKLLRRLIQISSLGSTIFSGYVLFSLTVSILITIFGFTPIIDDFVLFALFTMTFRFLT